MNFGLSPRRKCEPGRDRREKHRQSNHERTRHGHRG